jgi:hypothetical protein
MVGGVHGLNCGQKWALKRLESQKSRSHLGSTGCGRHEPTLFCFLDKMIETAKATAKKTTAPQANHDSWKKETSTHGS